MPIPIRSGLASAAERYGFGFTPILQRYSSYTFRRSYERLSGYGDAQRDNATPLTSVYSITMRFIVLVHTREAVYPAITPFSTPTTSMASSKTRLLGNSVNAKTVT